jgi:hypothetical protein
MPTSSPFTTSLSSAEEAELRKRAAENTLPYFQARRAKIIPHGAEGMPNDAIALDWTPAAKWSPFGTSALLPTTSPGWENVLVRVTPGFFSPDLFVQVKVLACELPSTVGLCPATTRGIWCNKSNRAVSWPRSAAARCGVGYVKNPSDRGITAVGSSLVIPTSPPRPGACWISTPASGKTGR